MKPKYLEDNDTIALVAPSFGCTTSPYFERLAKTIKNMNKLNYNVYIGENVYLDNGIASSNTPKERAKEFMDAYSSNASVIWSVGGGETMMEMIPFINFEAIKRLPPKWFVGYSDNTFLVYTLATICNVESIYGICAPTAHDLKSCEVKDTLSILKGKKLFKGYPYYESIDVECLSPLQPLVLNKKKFIMPYNYTKPFSGILIGGCLDVLQFLCGTKYDKTKEFTESHKEIIFFMEACDLYAIGIRRALLQLKEASWFNNVKGFIIGRSLHQEPNYNELPEKSYIDILKSFAVPILLNCDIGHLHPTVPVICGAYATITYMDDNIIFKYK